MRGWKAPKSFCYLIEVSKTAPNFLSPFHSLEIAGVSSWDGLSFQSVYVQHSREWKPLAILKLRVLLHLHMKGTDDFCRKTTAWGFPYFTKFDSVNSLY